MACRPCHCQTLCRQKRGEFVRTSNRHDYALKPTGLTALNALKDAGYSCISVGKIDIFDSEGLTESNKSKSSVHGMEQTIDIAGRDFLRDCVLQIWILMPFGGIAVIQFYVRRN